MLSYIDFFVTLLHIDFGRKVLNVWKLVKNRVLEKIANNKEQNSYNNEFYKTTFSDFPNVGFLIYKISKYNFILKKKTVKIYNFEKVKQS